MSELDARLKEALRQGEALRADTLRKNGEARQRLRAEFHQEIDRLKAEGGEAHTWVAEDLWRLIPEAISAGQTEVRYTGTLEMGHAIRELVDDLQGLRTVSLLSKSVNLAGKEFPPVTMWVITITWDTQKP